MDKNTESKQKQLKRRGDELVFPIMALVFAIYYFYTIMDLSWEAQINGFLIGSILIILVFLFLIRTGLEVIRGNASLQFSDLFTFGRAQMARVGLFSLAVAYVLVIPWAGYTLTTFTFLIMAMFILGVRSPIKLLIIALVLSLTGYYFFISLLDTRFSPGPFENLINWLL